MTDALEQRAVAAAVAVAGKHGLVAETAVVIHSGSNVLVHLGPEPVVARVMTGTVVLHDDPRRWLERELSVLRFLTESDLAVSPSQLIAPGPHYGGGLWMTFTEWVADAGPAAELQDARGLGETLRGLHDALRPFSGPLDDLSGLLERIKRLLNELRPADADVTDAVAALGARLDALAPALLSSRLPHQAVHGDVSLRNLLRTPTRLVWNDFEDTFRGPVHWDVASYVGSLRIEGASPAFVREMLDGYGWGDADDLAPFLAAQDVYDVIWGMYDRQRHEPPG